jgi:hypothetical protein
MMSLTVSLAPFQTLIYVFPTLLFFISLISRLILTFSKKNEVIHEVIEFAENAFTDLLKNLTNEPNTNVNDLINKAMLNAKNNTQTLDKNNVFRYDILIEQERKKRNSHFLFSLFIDSLALSIANGVIIMFEAQNLFYGFVLLFIGVTFCLFGFTAVYVDSLGLATFVETLLIIIVFISEFVYLITSNIAWLYIIFEIFVIAIIVILVIVAVIAERQKKKLKPTTTQKKE